MVPLSFSPKVYPLYSRKFGSLEGPTRKPRHASVFSTHSDTQAVPAFHCIRVFKGTFSTRAFFFYAPTRCLPLFKRGPKTISTCFFFIARFDMRVSVFKSRVFAHLSSGLQGGLILLQATGLVRFSMLCMARAAAVSLDTQSVSRFSKEANQTFHPPPTDNKLQLQPCRLGTGAKKQPKCPKYGARFYTPPPHQP